MKYPLLQYLMEMYPGVEISTHERVDRDGNEYTQSRRENGRVIRFNSADARCMDKPNCFRVGETWVEWLDPKVPMPTAQEVQARLDEVEPAIDVRAARAQRLKDFNAKWTQVKLAEAILDNAVREELRADKEAL